MFCLLERNIRNACFVDFMRTSLSQCVHTSTHYHCARDRDIYKCVCVLDSKAERIAYAHNMPSLEREVHTHTHLTRKTNIQKIYYMRFFCAWKKKGRKERRSNKSRERQTNTNDERERERERGNSQLEGGH